MKEKILVVIIIFDRYPNLVRWIDCWNKCNKNGAELVVIHNNENSKESLKYRELCTNSNIKYIYRKNIGYDIGALQDIFKERLPGFDNDWDVLIWVADDFIPMNKDFVKLFLDKLSEPNTGIACTEISRQNVLHMRTSGFALRKAVSKTILFPADPIIDKGQCYEFEHKNFNVLTQLNKTRLKVKQVTEDYAAAPFWDIEIRAFLNRWDEFNNVFSKVEELPTVPIEDRKVVFICPIYNSYPEIVSSLINQTHKNWELLLLHDGPNTTNLKELISTINDSRIIYIESDIRKERWGHPLRQWALNEIKQGNLAKDANYITITNADNHLVPVFCEYLLEGFSTHPEAVATYCNQMIHGYLCPQQTTVIPFGAFEYKGLKWEDYRYGILQCKLQLGYIDCSCAMIKKDVACETGWRDVISHSSDWTYFSDIIKKYGEDKWVRINGCLLVHN